MSHTPTHEQELEQMRQERDEARASLEQAKQDGIRLGLVAARAAVVELLPKVKNPTRYEQFIAEQIYLCLEVIDGVKVEEVGK